MSSIFLDLGRRAERVFLWVLALGTTAGGLVVLAATHANITFRYAVNYAEPVLAAIVLNIPRTPLLYRGFQSEPFLINPYNPVYLYLSEAAMALTGSPLAAGRLVSFWAGAAACVLIFAILRLLGVRTVFSLLLAGLFCQMPAVRREWVAMRPDFTGLAFSLAAVACFVRQEKTRPRTAGIFYWTGLAFAFLAYFTKQNFLSAPACYFLYLAAERRFKEAVKFGFLFALLAAVPTLLWNHWTHGDYLLNQLMSVKKSFFAVLFFRFWKEFLLSSGPLLALSAGACVFADKNGVRKIVLFYFFFTALTTITLGKIGADTNYLLEFAAAACILGGLWTGEKGKNGPARAVIPLLLAAAVVQSVILPGTLRGTDYRPRKSEPHPFDTLAALVQKLDGPVLSENMGILIAAGKPIVYEPYGFAQLAYAGMWDEKKILDRLDRKEFPLILLESNLWIMNGTSRFTPAFVQHLRQNYRPVKVIAGQILCVPIPPASVASHA